MEHWISSTPASLAGCYWRGKDRIQTATVRASGARPTAPRSFSTKIPLRRRLAKMMPSLAWP